MGEYRCKDSWGIDVVSAKWADKKIAKLRAEKERASQLLLEAEDRSVQNLGAAIQEKAKRERAEAELAAARLDIAAHTGRNNFLANEIADLRSDCERHIKIASEAQTELAAYRQYRKANPLGGPARMFEAIADRIRSGEDYDAVLADYGVTVEGK